MSKNGIFVLLAIAAFLCLVGAGCDLLSTVDMSQIF